MHYSVVSWLLFLCTTSSTVASVLVLLSQSVPRKQQYLEVAIATVSTSSLLFQLFRPRNVAEALPGACMLESGPSIASLLTIEFFTDFVRSSAKHPDTTEAPDLPSAAKPATVLRDWRNMRRQDWNVKLRLFWFFRQELAEQFAAASFVSILQVTPPFFLYKILQYLASDNRDKRWALTYAILMALSQTAEAILSSRCLVIGRIICVKLRGILTGELYSKTLRQADIADTSTDSVTGSGRVINLVSVDVTQGGIVVPRDIRFTDKNMPSRGDIGLPSLCVPRICCGNDSGVAGIVLCHWSGSSSGCKLCRARIHMQ